MSFKDIFHLELWRSLYLADRNCLCNVGRSHHEEHFRKIILNLTSGSGRNVIKGHFLSRALAAHLFDGVELFLQF